MKFHFIEKGRFYMNVKELYLSPTTKIANDYLLKDEKICSFFEYDYLEENTYKHRLQHLQKRSYQREQLVQALTPFMESLQYHEKAIEQLQRLRDPNTVAIVGGQQPGVLTGPLYTIYKIVTIIQLAKKQEEQLQVPVVPIFWIAGEDHDFDEINHLFIQKEEKIEKIAIPPSDDKRKQLANVELDKEQLELFMKEVFRSFKETNYTADLLLEVEKLAKSSTTYVDFFANLINWLFQDEGLILINSADPNVRKIEGELFGQIIEKNEQIYEAFSTQTMRLVDLGYPRPIELQEDHANLFYIDEGKREKITRVNENEFIIGANIYSKQQMLAIAHDYPERLSNNVVTRPIMQEYLLPVLAFVGGPGEIAYWSTLKGVFSLFDFKMPPVVPRLSFTILEEKHEKWMKEFQLQHEDLFGHLQEKKEQWFNSQKQWDIEQQIEEAKQAIYATHLPLQQLSYEISPSLKKLAEKNYAIIESQLEFLQKKLESTVRSQFENELVKFDILQNSVRPLEKPQERAYNIFYFLNVYGMPFIELLCKNDWEINEKHKMMSVLFS